MYIGLSNIPFGFPVLGYALIIGIFMIPIQAISMTFYAKLKTKEDLV
jgi:MFS-type transporter involved in bile tolerance (Atg22 family)